MKVILLKNVKKVGQEGQVIDVKGGFARNFLIPQGFALLSSKDNCKKIEDIKLRQAKVVARQAHVAGDLKSKLEELSLTIVCQAKDDEQIYGSVTEAQIAKALEAEEIKISSNQIIVNEPIKKLGVYNLTVKLTPEIDATLRLWVVKK